MTATLPAPPAPTSGIAPILALHEVTKTYAGDVQALAGVTLDIHRNEMVAIVGQSGSGKSTLLHITGTLDLPTTGTVRLAGRDVSTLSDKALSGLRSRTIGFVFQQFFLLAGTSAVDNVATGAVYTGMSRSERRRRATEALERVGLVHRLDHYPNQLSGGERQRVAVARALINDPAVILADEPTGNLDSRTEATIIELLRGLHADGTGVVVITHAPEIAAQMPRQVTLRDGRIVDDLHRTPTV